MEPISSIGRGIAKGASAKAKVAARATHKAAKEYTVASDMIQVGVSETSFVKRAISGIKSLFNRITGINALENVQKSKQTELTQAVAAACVQASIRCPDEAKEIVTRELAAGKKLNNPVLKGALEYLKEHGTGQKLDIVAAADIDLPTMIIPGQDRQRATRELIEDLAKHNK